MGNFNPRSHKGSDDTDRVRAVEFMISIHAPTRGATVKEWINAGSAVISIHAPTRGATRHMRLSEKTQSCDFNPRSHKGSDGATAAVLEDGTISIHAPTRGATLPHDQLSRTAAISIHAPTRGATGICVDTVEHSKISIHAPTRGATKKYCERQEKENISIHAPTRGATWWRVILIRGADFNPRSHKGSDLRRPSPKNRIQPFQSTLPQGERRLFLIVILLVR